MELLGLSHVRCRLAAELSGSRQQLRAAIAPVLSAPALKLRGAKERASGTAPLSLWGQYGQRNPHGHVLMDDEVIFVPRSTLWPRSGAEENLLPITNHEP